MAKNPTRRNKDMSNDALAALGLDVEDATVANTEVNTSATTDTDTETTRATREEVDVGEIEIGEIDYIPASKRSSGGSKYKFDELAAPRVVDGKTKYSFFKVTLQPGVDELKLKRSVQSATTQANAIAKKAGSDEYYITRALVKDGKFEAIQVIRTDDRPVDESDDKAA